MPILKGSFVYIDCENLNTSVEQCGYKELDYPRLYNWLKSKRKAQRVYLYASYSTVEKKEKLEALAKVGYVLRIKEVMQYPGRLSRHKLKCPHCTKTANHHVRSKGRRKANCDSELTLDVIRDGKGKKYSEIIVFSGDGDFAEMYVYVAEGIKKSVSVYSPMGEKAGKRTSTKIKNLRVQGIIKLNALEGILGNYGIK